MSVSVDGEDKFEEPSHDINCYALDVQSGTAWCTKSLVVHSVLIRTFSPVMARHLDKSVERAKQVRLKMEEEAWNDLKEPKGLKSEPPKRGSTKKRGNRSIACCTATEAA
jgi:hypothetical protein